MFLLTVINAAFERFLGVLSSDALAVHPDVDQHQVIVSAAGDEPQSLFL